jgi:hypothetical protein
MFLLRAALQIHYEGKLEGVGPWNSRPFWKKIYPLQKGLEQMFTVSYLKKNLSFRGNNFKLYIRQACFSAPKSVCVFPEPEAELNMQIGRGKGCDACAWVSRNLKQNSHSGQWLKNI